MDGDLVTAWTMTSADLRWYDDNFVGTELNKGTSVAGRQMVGLLVGYGHITHITKIIKLPSDKLTVCS